VTKKVGNPNTQNRYGAEPLTMGEWELDFGEYMVYQYLPVNINGIDGLYDIRLPGNLEFARDIIEECIDEELSRNKVWSYIYVTAKRGFATPGNPLNRPGWHADGFGTPDVNYVWVDRFPTVFAIGEFGDISDDHIESVKQFTAAIDESARVWREDFPKSVGLNRPKGKIKLKTYPDKTLVRLDDTIIHAAPEVPAPGGERSFFKVSFSNDKYNLKGNAHNYLLDYEWDMFDREFIRNDPARAGKDAA